MRNVVCGLCIMLGSCVLGFALDVGCHIATPALYWMIGITSGVAGTLIIASD